MSHARPDAVFCAPAGAPRRRVTDEVDGRSRPCSTVREPPAPQRRCSSCSSVSRGGRRPIPVRPASQNGAGRSPGRGRRSPKASGPAAQPIYRARVHNPCRSRPPGAAARRRPPSAGGAAMTHATRLLISFGLRLRPRSPRRGHRRAPGPEHAVLKEDVGPGRHGRDDSRRTGDAGVEGVGPMCSAATASASSPISRAVVGAVPGPRRQPWDRRRKVRRGWSDSMAPASPPPGDLGPAKTMSGR